MRGDLPPLTERIASLPIDERGYPVPYFVQWIDGKPDFRIMDGEKLRLCVKAKVCWCCGQALGAFKSFVVGPMCTINRTSGEPPSHTECAEWSVRGCPFLSRPNMVRRQDDLIRENKGNVAGVMIERNPGVTVVWTTKRYKLKPDGMGKMLFDIGEPVSVTWWREGRPATHAEVMESIRTGLPILQNAARRESDKRALAAATKAAMKFLPEP